MGKRSSRTRSNSTVKNGDSKSASRVDRALDRELKDHVDRSPDSRQTAVDRSRDSAGGKQHGIVSRKEPSGVEGTVHRCPAGGGLCPSCAAQMMGTSGIGGGFGASMTQGSHGMGGSSHHGNRPTPENQFLSTGHKDSVLTARTEDANGSGHYLSRKPTSGPTIQRSCSSCGSVDHEDLDLPVQPSLEVSSPDDPAEREAEAVAEQVMAMDDPTEESISRQIDSRTSVQRVSTDGAVSGGVESKVRQGASGNGKSLPKSIRRDFEPKFGADFSNVSVHENAEAASSINAKAYTFGSDIVFNKGEYEPNTKSGKKLLAHELTHVKQQGGASDRT